MIPLLLLGACSTEPPSHLHGVEVAAFTARAAERAQGVLLCSLPGPWPKDHTAMGVWTSGEATLPYLAVRTPRLPGLPDTLLSSLTEAWLLLAVPSGAGETRLVLAGEGVRVAWRDARPGEVGSRSTAERLGPARPDEHEPTPARSELVRLGAMSPAEARALDEVDALVGLRP